jgi:hypothetical protein
VSAPGCYGDISITNGRRRFDSIASYRAPTVEVPAIAIERFQETIAGSIPTIIRTYKAAVTRLIWRIDDKAAPVWQRNYYEHIIRNPADWNRIRLYIESNAAHWKEDEENPAKP